MGILTNPPWDELWRGLNLVTESFESLGLERELPDSVLWQTCQERQLVLITANRRRRGPDSLETTIETCQTPESLPVITLANANRILKSKAYARRTAEQIMDYLVRIEDYRGTGRLYAP